MIIEKNRLEKKRLEKKHELMRRQCARARRKLKSNERRKKLTRQLLARGKEGEIKMLEILKKKYDNIVDNNIENKYSTIDFSDNKLKIDFECKNRVTKTHNQFDKTGYVGGLMYGRNKFDYSLKRLKEGYKQIVYWPCSDGIWFWELYDPEKQKHEYTFGENSNKELNQQLKDVVYVKTKYLTKLQ
jgi:hypothetical protein